MESCIRNGNSIKEILFYQIKSDDLAGAHAMETVLKGLSFRGNVIFADTESGLLQNATMHSLVVSPLSSRGRLGNLMFHHGIAHYISLRDFLITGPRMVLAGEDNVIPKEKVILAFLPLHIENLIHSILYRLGYRISLAHSAAMLTKLLESKPCCMILDSDISYFQSKIRIKRESMFREIRKSMDDNPDLSIILLKDFDQGSLFEDMQSSIRQISNILLSPQEFLLFLLKFISAFSYDLNTFLYQKIINNNPYLPENKPFNVKSIGVNFKNMKETFYKMADGGVVKRMQKNHEYIKSMEKNAIFLQPFLWLQNHLLHTEANASRESFAFISSIPELPAGNSTEKEEPFHKKKDAPQDNGSIFSPPPSPME